MEKKDELPRDKTNKVACAPSEDSDQPGHLPSLIRIFAVRMKKAWVLSYPLRAQRRLWSDWADAQADLSLHWANTHFVGFVMRRLRYLYLSQHKWKWYLLHMRTAKALVSLHIHAVSPEPSLFAQYRDVEEASDKEPAIWTYWVTAHARLKNHNVHYPKVPFLMRWPFCIFLDHLLN